MAFRMALCCFSDAPVSSVCHRCRYHALVQRSWRDLAKSPNTRLCDQNTAKVCSGDGKKFTDTPCEDKLCYNGQCVVCEPDRVDCSTLNVARKCHHDGMAWDTIPEHVYHGLHRYFEFGGRTGSFLEAVLSNDFSGAVLRADMLNIYNIRNFACFLHNEAPHGSWGSPEAYKNWIAQGGLRGILKES